MINNGRVAHILLESEQIEIESNRIFYKMSVIECILMLEEIVMHLPELTLLASGFCSFSGMFSMRMYLDEREVTKDEAQMITETA